MPTNKELGNKLENYVCDILGALGFWVHKLTQTEVGQPADIIAIKEGHPYLIDCKYCETTSFILSRVEPNQISAMQRWAECGNGVGQFFIYFRKTKELYMLDFDTIKEYLDNGEKSIPLATFQAHPEWIYPQSKIWGAY